MTPAARIPAAVRSVRQYLLRTLARTVAVWCAVAILLLLALAPLLAGGEGWQAGSPAPLLIVTLILALLPVGLRIWRTLGRRWYNDLRVTRAMDGTAGLDPGAVLGGLELSRLAPPGTSPGLRTLALTEVGDRLRGDARTLSGTLGGRLAGALRRSVLALAAAIPILLLVLLLAPARTLGAWGGLLRPIAVLVEPALPPLGVEPGDAEVARDAVVEIVVHAPLRDSVWLRWDRTGQVTASVPIALHEGRGSASLPPLRSEIRYWIEAPDGARTPVHTLVPIDPLFVGTLAVEVTHPPHTHLPPTEYRNEIPPLIVPAGTHLRIRGEGSRSVGQGELLDEEGNAAMALEVQGTRFEGSWVPGRSGSYRWRFTDEAGAPAATLPEPLSVELVADRPPEVEIVYPGVDTVMPIDLRQPLIVQTRDDYGIARIEIVVRRVSALGEAGEPVVQGIDLGGSGGAVARPVLDLSGWRLSPGDTIRYRVRAVDNHPAAQTTASTEFALWLGGAAELERAVQEEIGQAAEEVAELAGEAREAEREMRDLQTRAEAEESRNRGAERQADFADREEIAQALERQEELIAAVDSLQRKLAELRRDLGDAGISDPDTEAALGELEELLEQISPEDAREMATPEDDLAAMDPEALLETLEEMAADQERMRERLEDSLEEFRDAAIEQDFRATGLEARELAEEQEILARALAEGGNEELRSEQQAALEMEAGALQERLEHLQEMLAEAGEAQAGAGVQEARHQLSQARQQMQQAAQMAQQGQQQQAAEQAQAAAGDLSELSQQIDQAQMQMQQEQMQQLQAALGRTAADALALARRQTGLQSTMQGANAAELAAMRSDEAAIAQGVRNLAENYAGETEMMAPGARDLLATLGQAMTRIDATLAAMENPRSRGSAAAAEAEQVVQSLNEVARMAMTSGQQSQSQGAASASQQMMQQLQQLAQQQGEIMQDAASLTPMRLGQETLQEQMQEMAGRQEEVAEELGEISEAEERGSAEGDPLGDLSAFAEEAERLAEALAQGRLDPEVLRRQERLFHRLLDAGRTLERDEESEERESEAVSGFERSGVEALSGDALDMVRFEIPNATLLRALPPAQRALVLRYFERLNRSNVPANPPPATPLR